jgi:hypothetical protein
MRGENQIWLTLGVSALLAILPFAGYGASLTIGNDISTTGNLTVGGTVTATSFITASTPYQFFLQAKLGDPQCGTNFCGFYLPAVPANKRLVITNVSVTIYLDATAVVQNLRLLVYDSSFNVLSQFTVPYNPNTYPADPISQNNPRRYVVNEHPQWWVEAGQTPILYFHTSNGSLDTSWPNQFLITGYLVDLSP